MRPERAPSVRNATVTKEKILAAAVLQFALCGFSETSLRDIAERAEVSLPLVSRYFGSKAGLFEAALRRSLESPYLEVPRHSFGESLVMMICSGSTIGNPASISSLSIGDQKARAIATNVITELVVEPLTAWLGGTNARRRAEAITMLGAGLNTHVHQLPVVSLARPIDLSDPLLAWFADSLQCIVNGTDHWGAM